MPIAWRIVKSAYAENAFDGEGARLYGGRWNSPGTRMVYATESVSLAVLEIVVNLEEVGPLPAFSLCSVEFDDGIFEALDRSELPEDWRASPGPLELQRLGDAWARDHASAVLKVPSAIIPSESNYLINPNHEDFGSIKLGDPQPYDLDPRLIPG